MNLGKKAAPAATEAVIKEISDLIQYLDKSVTKGMTTKEMQKASKSAVNHLSTAMSELRKGLSKLNEDSAMNLYAEAISQLKKEEDA